MDKNLFDIGLAQHTRFDTNLLEESSLYLLKEHRKEEEQQKDYQAKHRQANLSMGLTDVKLKKVNKHVRFCYLQALLAYLLS